MPDPMPDPMPDEPTGPEQPPAEEPTGRDRLVASLRKPGGRGQITAGVLMLVLGFAAVVQVRSNTTDAEYVGARQDELINLINSLSLASDRAENEIAELEETRNSLLNDTQARRTALERARQRASGIFETTRKVFELANADGITSAEAADRLAERRMREVGRLRGIHLT